MASELTALPLLFGNLDSFKVIISEQVPKDQIWFATQAQLDEALEYSQQQIQKALKEKGESKHELE